jgi:hypothetical protein
MPAYYNTVTKQNITDLLYKASLINNTDLQESAALSELVSGMLIVGIFGDDTQIQTAVNNGTITLDTYIIADGGFFAPRAVPFVDTAGNILAQY